MNNAESIAHNQSIFSLGASSRFNIHSGLTTTITVIKQLTKEGVWLIGFRGTVVRAHTSLALHGGQNLTVRTAIVDGALYLMRANQEQAATHTLLARDTHPDSALLNALIRNSYPISASAILHIKRILRSSPKPSAEMIRCAAIIADKGLHGNLHQLLDAICCARPHTSHHQQRERRERHNLAPDSQQRQERAAITQNNDERLRIFNQRAGSADMWQVIPFHETRYNISGSIRLHYAKNTLQLTDAVVRMHAHSAWAIEIRSIHTEHTTVAIHCQDTRFAKQVSQRIEKIKPNLKQLGVAVITAQRWSAEYDGFTATTEQNTPYEPINYHV